MGSTAEMMIAEAREIARMVIRRVEQDCRRSKRRSRGRHVATVTAEWLKRHVDKNKLRTAPEYRRMVRKYILPHWGERGFEEIRRSDIAKLLDHVEDNYGSAPG